MVVEEPTQRTQSIYAPSYSWNKNIRHTATFRWFYYPDDETRLHLIPSISSRVNRGISIEIEKGLPREGQWTSEANIQAQRSIFFRFFGLGSRTLEADETSFTRLYGQAMLRHGYSFTKHWNAGLTFAAQRILTESIGVSGFPKTHDRFVRQKGLAPSTLLSPGLSFRFDSRAQKEYSTRGTFIESSVQHNAGLAGSSDFLRTSLEARTLWEEIGQTLTGAARLSWTYAGGPRGDIPFHYLSTLGGAYRMRGFTENRFYDRGAWSLEIEQRFAMFQTNIYDVIADWRVDPFVAIGQVYDGSGDMFDHVQIAAGLGFRAWVRPNVLGRVDTAIAGEGLKIYVELGYPF